MYRYILKTMIAFVCVMPMALPAVSVAAPEPDEVLEGTHEGVDLYKVTYYDEDGVSYRVDFFADNENPHDIKLTLDVKVLEGLNGWWDTGGLVIWAREKRRVAVFILKEGDEAGNYEFDWYVDQYYGEEAEDDNHDGHDHSQDTNKKQGVNSQ